MQCKHWKTWTVGAPSVREFLGALVAAKLSRGIYVTSGRFTRDATVLAKENGIELVDGTALVALLSSDTRDTKPRTR